MAVDCGASMIDASDDDDDVDVFPTVLPLTDEPFLIVDLGGCISVSATWISIAVSTVALTAAS